MRRPTRKQLIIAGIGALILAAIVFAFMPQAVPVETAVVTRGALQVVVEEEGETRLKQLYVVTSPVAAYARRIAVEVGDLVRAGQPLVQLEAPRSAILDPRMRDEAVARLAGTRSGLAQAQILAAQATSERQRVERLVQVGAQPERALELAKADEERALAARDAARAEVTAAQAALDRVSRSGSLAVQDVIRAPAAGRVLAVHLQSGGAIAPGVPLLEIGNTEQLEIAVDVLSRDALRIRPGTRVLLDQWTETAAGDGERAVMLETAVTRIEPRAFTRVSALGVEERRVTVVAALADPPAELGPGYRVRARFVVWEGANVLRVPTSALFRADEGWAAFVVENGRAVRRDVTVGHQAGLLTEVVAGLEEGDVVIVHPGNRLQDGTDVTATADS